MVEIFSLVGRVAIEGIDNVNKRLSKMDREARKLTRGLDKLQRRAERTGRSLTRSITTPLAIAGGAVTAFGASFESAMTKSLAIMGDVSDDMRDQMETVARDIAKTSTFSAKQAGEAYFFLASAGLNAAESMEALPRVAAFAQAGMFDLALATDLLTDAQSALGLSVDDTAQNMANMSRVSDVLVKANTLANATVQQFSEALTNRAGAALRILGKDVEEGVAVLAAFADQGVKGAEAGTKLDIVLRDLQKASLNNRRAFIDAGVSIFDASGEMRNIAEIIAELEERFADMSDEQKRAELSTLGFTDKSVAATLALIGTSDAIEEYETKLRDAAGTTDEVRDKQLEDFTAQMIILRNKAIDAGLTLWKDLRPAIMEGLVPVVEAAVEKLGDLARWFNGLPVGIKKTILQVTFFAAALGPLLIVLSKLIAVISGVVTALATLKTALVVVGTLAAANPVILGLTAALAGLAAILVLTSDKWSKWQDTIKDDIVKKQTDQIVRFRDELLGLYDRVNQADVEFIPEDEFRAAQARIRELETNLADLGITLEGGVEAKMISLLEQTENLDAVPEKIDDIEKSVEELNAALEKGANLIKEQSDAAKKSAEERAAFEAQWTENYKREVGTRIQILEMEREKALEQARKLKADEQAINDTFDERRLAIEEEGFAEERAILERRNEQRESFEKAWQRKLAELGATEEERLVMSRERELEIADRLGADKTAIIEYYNERQREIEKRTAGSFLDNWSRALSEFGGLSRQATSVRIANIDKAAARERKAIQSSQMSEEEKAAALEQLDNETAARRKAAQREEASRQKTIGIFEGIVNTASAVVEALPNIPLSIAVSALGAAKTAMIAAQPLPLAEGGLVKARPGGTLAQIGEAGEDEVVMPLRSGIEQMVDTLLARIGSVSLSAPAPVPAPAFASDGGAGETSTGGTVNLNVGTLVADAFGLKQLERQLRPLRIAERQRRGAS